MAKIPFLSHLDLVKFREEAFENLLHEGSFSPLLLKHILGMIFLVLVPLLIRHTNTFQSKLVRFTFHAIFTGFSVYTLLHVRFIGPANGYSVGVITIWFWIWSSTILVFNDVQKDFTRIEKEYVQPSSTPVHDSDQPGVVLAPKDTKHHDTSPIVASRDKGKRKVYQWQSFPDSFPHRVDWVLDLVLNFRGPNWNWRARSIPLPNSVLNDIGDQGSSRQRTKSELVVFPDSSTRLRQALFSFLRDYIVLDMIKVVMMRDPFFWGFVDNCPPPPWPFSVLSFSPILVRIYRLLLSMSGISFALDIIVSLDPLFFLGLSLAFPGASRSITHQPLDEAWLYPPTFGSASSVLDSGLIGAWNTWWHQLFRFGFSETGRFVSHLIIPVTQKQHSSCKLARRLLQVLVAFSMSGLMHAMGSYTAFADTKPFNTFLFFFLQGIAVLVQGLFFFRKTQPQPHSKLQSRTLTTTTRALNFAFVFLWFYFTAPLIADDFARSGLWTFEPLPISPISGLRISRWLGVQSWEDGQGWLCWRSPWVETWDGETWWTSGIRFR